MSRYLFCLLLLASPALAQSPPEAEVDTTDTTDTEEVVEEVDYDAKAAELESKVSELEMRLQTSDNSRKSRFPIKIGGYGDVGFFAFKEIANFQFEERRLIHEVCFQFREALVDLCFCFHGFCAIICTDHLDAETRSRATVIAGSNFVDLDLFLHQQVEPRILMNNNIVGIRLSKR